MKNAVVVYAFSDRNFDIHHLNTSVLLSGDSKPSKFKSRLSNEAGAQMPPTNVEQKALKLLRAFENAGRSVNRITLDGRKIVLDLSPATPEDEYDRIEMRHGKT